MGASHPKFDDWHFICLLKKTPPARLLESLKEATQGGASISPEIAQKVIRLFRDVRPPEQAHYQLSLRRINQKIVKG